MGARIPHELTTDQSSVDHASRIGWELGADVLEVPYTGNPARLRDLVDRTPVPVAILGGPTDGSELETLRDVENAIEANARGVMIGRSIWQRPNPEGMVRAMRASVHEERSAETAVDHLDS